METRELFWSIGASGIVLFYALGFTAIGIFVLGGWRLVAKYARGVRLSSGVDIRTGVLNMVGGLSSHRMLRRRDRMTGLMHRGVFYGFLIAAIGTTIIFVDADIVGPIFGVPCGGEISTWRPVS